MTQKQAEKEEITFKMLVSFINKKSTQECIYFSDFKKINEDKYDELVYFNRLLENAGYVFRIKTGVFSIEKLIPQDISIKTLIDKYFKKYSHA